VETVPLNCNGCGAPLEVAAGANYATCGHCGARLAVKRTGSAAYTEVLEKLDRTTEAIAGHLAELTRQNEVERIDREWERERASYLITGKHGSRSLPTQRAGVMIALVMGGFGLIWTAFAASFAPFPFPLFGLLFVAFAVYTGLSQVKSAEKLAEAEARYHQRRAEALRKDPGPPPG
jgi:DNA-directed RNA polymerase subunit RPC12/RpoP